MGPYTMVLKSAEIPEALASTYYVVALARGKQVRGTVVGWLRLVTVGAPNTWFALDFWQAEVRIRELYQLLMTQGISR